MAVVTTGELDDLRPAGESAREPNCRHRGLSPELTSRTFSTASTRDTISSASRTSPGLGAPKDNPWAAAWVTDSITAGARVPRLPGPMIRPDPRTPCHLHP